MVNANDLKSFERHRGPLTKALTIKKIQMSSKSIHAAVAEQITQSGTKVEEIIIHQLVQEEVQKRKTGVISGLSKLDTLRKESKKLSRPDVVSHIPDGNGGFTKHEAFSEDALKKKKAADEAVQKLEKAIDTALESNDGDSYNKLYELVK